MASSGKKSAAVSRKREPHDDFETKPSPKKPKETTEGLGDCLQRVEFLGTQSDQPSSISVEETVEGLDDGLQRVEFLETKSVQPNLISMEETVEGLDETPVFYEETTEGFADSLQRKVIPVRKIILFVGHISPQTTISDVINFFKDVEGVVRVQLAEDQNGEHMGWGCVEFASSDEAKKALQNKNGEYLHDCKILLDGALMVAAYFPPRFCVDHTVWAEAYLGRESLPIGEDATFPNFVEDFALREKTLFVANLSPQTKIPDIIDFFTIYGDVVSVRLIVNHKGKHVGYGFVEFACPMAAKKLLIDKNGEYLHDHIIFLALATTFPYTPRPKYNLAEMLWYEDCLRRKILPIEKDETPPDFVEEVALRNRSLLIGNFSPQTEISHIVNFFKDVGEVVHVRLSVDRQGQHVGHGFVEFASTSDAKKALEKKNGEYLHDRKIFLDVDMTDPYPPGSKCCIDHKVWYEDYLRRENLLIVEDMALIESLVEEVASRKKTLFVSNIVHKTKISHITKFFKDVAEVFRVRLIVNHMGEHVGCGFVEFNSINEAKKALQNKNGRYLCGRRICLNVAEIAPYPLRPKYNRAEKIWYKDYLQRRQPSTKNIRHHKGVVSLETKQKRKGIFCGKKTTFSDDE